MRSTAEDSWWREAVVYQIYPRSYADANGDGIGDLAGARSRLPYLADLGIDAVWLSPFYTSPLRDGGYDVADYRDVDPRLGTLADIESFIHDAHAMGMRIIIDIVPNHTSSDHPWFQQALRDAPGTGAWQYYHAVRGRGTDGSQLPNDWQSAFGGPAWSPIPGATGWWYLHLFDPSQPDLNWENPLVRAEFESILRFWFDRGVDGFRIDVANSLVKKAGYPDAGDDAEAHMELRTVARDRPHWDRDEVQDIWSSWRSVADAYDPPRMFVSEAWVDTPERLSRYISPGRLHTSFNFDYLKAPWSAERIRTIVDSSLAATHSVDAPCTWVLSNHDVWRHRSRLAPVDDRGEPDLARGLDRARAATLFMLGLPGSAYLYQGEELGLPEVLDLDDDVRQDPVFVRTHGLNKGRDGCRVPIPWSGAEPSYGFGAGRASWLPQPAEWAQMSVGAQQGVPGSTLEFYRAALQVRRREPALGDGVLVWLTTPTDAAGFERPARDGGRPVRVVLNTGFAPMALPDSLGEVILASRDEAVTESGGMRTLTGESAVWLLG